MFMEKYSYAGIVNQNKHYLDKNLLCFHIAEAINLFFFDFDKITSFILICVQLSTYFGKVIFRQYLLLSTIL